MNDANRNDKLGPAKPLYEFTHRGETYYLDFETQRVKAALESWAISKAVAGLAKRRPMMSEDDYRSALDGLNARIESGDYAMDGGKAVAGPDGKPTLEANTLHKILRTQTGIVAMVRILLTKKHPAATDALVIEMMGDPDTQPVLQALLERVQADSVPKSGGSADSETAA